MSLLDQCRRHAVLRLRVPQQDRECLTGREPVEGQPGKHKGHRADLAGQIGETVGVLHAAQSMGQPADRKVIDSDPGFGYLRACCRARGGRIMDSRIERLCVERGLKMTGQRRVIARVLSEASDHPDVEELYRRAAALDPRISIATVYRTVRLLEENNILERRDFGGGRARYEASEHGVHYHLIDVESGRVVEFESGEHERLIQAIAEGLGFRVVSMRLEVFARRGETIDKAARHGAEPAASGATGEKDVQMIADRPPP